jgi:hypothetical protein
MLKLQSKLSPAQADFLLNLVERAEQREFSRSGTSSPPVLRNLIGALRIMATGRMSHTYVWEMMELEPYRYVEKRWKKK